MFSHAVLYLRKIGGSFDNFFHQMKHTFDTETKGCGREWSLQKSEALWGSHKCADQKSILFIVALEMLSSDGVDCAFHLYSSTFQNGLANLCKLFYILIIQMWMCAYHWQSDGKV